MLRERRGDLQVELARLDVPVQRQKAVHTPQAGSAAGTACWRSGFGGSRGFLRVGRQRRRGQQQSCKQG